MDARVTPGDIGVPVWLVMVADVGLRALERRDPGLLQEMRAALREEAQAATVVTLRGPRADRSLLADLQEADVWLAGLQLRALKGKKGRRRR